METIRHLERGGCMEDDANQKFEVVRRLELLALLRRTQQVTGRFAHVKIAELGEDIFCIYRSVVRSILALGRSCPADVGLQPRPRMRKALLPSAAHSTISTDGGLAKSGRSILCTLFSHV